MMTAIDALPHVPMTPKSKLAIVEAYIFMSTQADGSLNAEKLDCWLDMVGISHAELRQIVATREEA